VPLLSTGLAQDLEQLFSGTPSYPADHGEAARGFAAAYAAYAAGALAAPTVPVSLSLEAAEPTLAQSIESAFRSAASAGDVNALAAALDTAFVAFWLSPPVQFLPPGPPVVTGLVTLAPPSVLTPLLSALLGAGVTSRASAGSQANSLASVLDGWTRTVIVTNTPVTGTPVTVPLT
jgi:hypothetical protein